MLARPLRGAYSRYYRAMASFVQPLVADALLNGMALMSLGLVGYLFWLRFREKRSERKQLQARERDRKNHWGYL